MDKPTYKFSDREIQRYEVHGIAHAKINQIIPTPESECSIDVGALIEISQPRYVRVKRTPLAPQLTFLSGKVKEIPKSAIPIDPDKELENLEVKIWRLHPKLDYSDVKVIPIYRVGVTEEGGSAF